MRRVARLEGERKSCAFWYEFFRQSPYRESHRPGRRSEQVRSYRRLSSTPEEFNIDIGSLWNFGFSGDGALVPAVLALYLALGAVAGLLAGLFGVGGGLIIVPALIWVFHGQGMNPGLLVKMAVGTSLASIIATALASIRAHQRRRAVRWELVRRLTPGIMVGAWMGAAVADLLDPLWLQRIFGAFALIVGLQMAFLTRFDVAGRVPGRVGMALAGGVIGMISAIVGVGGGTISVPFLVRHGVPMREAVASSAACGLPIATAGALGFLIAGLGEPGLPAGSLGFIYGPALFPIIVGSILVAPLGARLAHSLPVARLRQLFALLLGVVGGKLLLF